MFKPINSIFGRVEKEMRIANLAEYLYIHQDEFARSSLTKMIFRMITSSEFSEDKRFAELLGYGIDYYDEETLRNEIFKHVLKKFYKDGKSVMDLYSVYHTSSPYYEL